MCYSDPWDVSPAWTCGRNRTRTIAGGFEGAPFQGQDALCVRAYLAILIILWAVHAKVER